MTKIIAPLLLLLTLLLMACGPSSSPIAQVTAIPTRDPSVPVPTLDLLKAAPTLTPNPTFMALSLTRAALPTPTPLSVRMASGESLTVLRATDQAVQQESTDVLDESDDPIELSFNDFYSNFDPASGPVLSEFLKALDGKKVIINGYMAPPLALELDWFQLTLQPIGGCAFCGDSYSVAEGTALIYPINDPVIFTGNGLRVIGTVEVGEAADPATGMVSLVRIYADEVEIVEVDW